MIPRYVLTPLLSPAEERVLCALLAGHTTCCALARVLYLSEATVKVHMYNIRQKCRAGNVVEIVLWAWRAGYELPAASEESTESFCNKRNPN